MRLRTLLALATLFSLALSWLLWKDLLRDPPLAMRPIAPTPRERQLGFLLTPKTSALAEQRLPTPLVINAPLDRAIERLRDGSGANIFVNWRMLHEKGLPRDTPVSVDASGLAFADALRALLAPVTTYGSGLSFRIGHEMIIDPLGVNPSRSDPNKIFVTVSTKGDLGRNSAASLYDIRELMQPLLGPTPSQYTGDQAAPILQRITGEIDPASWHVSGEFSSPKLRFLNGGTLFITQTDINQRDIARLLHDLRRTRRLRSFALRTALLTAAVLTFTSLTHVVIRYYVTRSRRLGLCRHCGYDLRASPDRCPECGSPATIARVAPTAPTRATQVLRATRKIQNFFPLPAPENRVSPETRCAARCRRRSAGGYI